METNQTSQVSAKLAAHRQTSMVESLHSPRLISFGIFEVDLQAGELRRAGQKLKLTGQPLQVLTILLERSGEVVTREELQKRLWPDTFVDIDHSLNATINKIREVLGDSAESPRWIETLPRRGYRFIGPVENRPDRYPPTPLGTGTYVAQRTGTLRLLILLGACVLLAGVGWFVHKWQRPASTVQRALTRVTFDQGLQFGATWSPDNRMIAYSSDRGGKFDIWVQQISGGDPIQITKGPGHNWQPDWSPDGKYIAYRSEDGEGGLFIIPALGGAGLARKIVSAGFYPRWSPDGSRILFQTSQMTAENEFNVVTLDGTPPRKVFTGFGPLDITMRSAAWHPDGERISIWVGGHSPVPTFWTIPVSGGEGVESKIDPQVLRQLGEVPGSLRNLVGNDGQFSWMPSGKAIIFEGTFRGVRNLWKMSMDRETLRANAIERLTTGSGLDTDFALSADGKRIAFTIKSEPVQAWVFPFDTARGRLAGAGRSVTSPGVEAWEPNLSRDGSKLAFSTLRAGKRELWEQSLPDGRAEPIAPDDNYIRFNPHWSPDGRRLAYGRSLVGSTGYQHFVWSPEGRVEEPLIPLSKQWLNLYDWSPDGKQLVLSQQTSDNTIQISALSAIPLLNSEPAPRKIAAKAGHYLWEPHFSPDGRWIVFLDQSTNLTHTESIIYVTPATGGPWIRVTDGKFWDDKPQWAADGKTLYFISRQGGFYDVWGIRFNSAEGKVAGDRFRVTNFANSSLIIPNNMGDVALSITRDKLALSMSQVSGSIWVLNDVDQ